MNSTPRDAPGPGHRECLLPSVARTPSVTQVTPAKKITFLKRGDPQFAGVRLAVHQRAFRSFGALMDELSQRVPLSFGVRSVTTPRGLHGLSALEQLQDGGCYLCSDKKPPRTPGGLGQPRGRSHSTQQLREFEAPGTASTCKDLKASRRITLVKNGDPRLQQTVVLSHRNTRSLTAFLSKASDLLRFPVKHVYTTSGKRLDSLKALLRSPSMLVCAGLEPFRPLAMEDIRRKGSEPSSGQTSRNKSGSWGPKAKQSVIHARSRLENRPRQFSLMSERSGLSDPSSPRRACMCPAPDRHPLNTPARLGPLVAGEDIEKNVSVNEDGSLSVEMKVRFHLLGEDPLLWSRRLGGASTLTVTCGEGPEAGEEDLLGCVWKGHSGDPSEPGSQGLGPCEVGGVGAFDQGQRQPGSRYEIWMNPLYTSQGEWSASQWRSGLTQNSHSRAPRSQRVTSRRRGSKDRASPASSDRPPGGSEPNSSCCSGSLEDAVASCGPHLASGAGEGRGEGAALGHGDHDGCLKPRTGDLTHALPDSSASAGSHEEWSERDKSSQSHPSKTPRGATQQGVPGSPTVNPSSIGNEDPQAEEIGQGVGHPQSRNRSRLRPRSARGPAGSGDDAVGYTSSSACASALGRSRKQESRASALSSPSTSVLSRGAQRARPRQQHNPKDIHCPLDPPVSRPTPRPSSGDRAHPHGPPPSLSESPQGTWNRASCDPGPPFSASRYSPDTRGLSSIPITPGSNSDCVSNFYLPDSPSAETEGGPEFRPCSPAPTPSDTSGPFSAPADGLGEKTGGDRFQPSRPLVLPTGWPEGGRLGAHGGSSCSHLGTALARGSSCGMMRPQGGEGPSSKACWVCSRYCPTPPRTLPSGKRHPSGCRSEGDRSADGEPCGDKAGEEKLDARHPRAPGSQGAASGRAVRAVRRGSPRSGPQLGRMVQGKLSGGGGGLEEREEGGSELLGALPRASPEAVVRAWLSNIPEEPTKHELEEGEDVAGHGLEGPQEDPAGKHSPDGPERSVWAGQLPLEQAASEGAEPEEVFPVASRASPKSADGLPCRGVSETPPEAGTSKGVAVDGGRGQRVIPSRVSTSLQIMKVLMGSRPGRPSSLPEVSHSEGRRLSRSAQALITCLARLHFFDDDGLGSPTSKVRFTDSPRFQELLSTFQALWPGSGLRNSELESDLRELGWRQALPALGPQVATEDFRPTSSSGVDVGSGSGGSGEGSGPCTVDCSLVSEKMELPLSISCQGPDSRTSGNPAVPGNRPLSSYEAEGAASEDGAEKNGREQTLGGELDQGDKNTVEEEGVQLEEIKEGKERVELQVEGVRGFPEEEGIMELELLGAGSQDGAGVWENKSLHEEERGDPTAVATQSSSGRRGSPTEPPRSLSERCLDTSGSQSGPKAEPPLEKLLGAAETGCGQTLDKLTQGPGERGTCKARRGSLISDPVWVSKLLKKMEKTFMDHLAAATAELCTRWGLQGDPLLDQMVAELQRDVSQRLQDSMEKELLKVQSWAGGAGAGPPREALRWEASLQTEQRRRRLQALRNLSPFSEQTRGRWPPSFSLEDLPVFRGALGSQLGVEGKGEEFCPCEACVRKKMAPAPPVDAVGSASAPIRKAFDLQHILQKKKGGCADGEVAPTVEREAELLHRDPSRSGTARGADGDPELGSGQGPGAEEGDPWGTEEEAGAQEKEGQTEPCVGSDPWEGLGSGEKGMGGEEGDLEAGCEAEDTGEAHALGGDGPGPGEQDADAGTTDTQEAAREKGSETGGGYGGDEEGSPQVGLGHAQSLEAPGDRSPSPGADPPQQRSGPRSGLSFFSTSSLGNCSLLSQKGSEDEPWDRCIRSIEDQAMDVPDPERKVTGMYPESSTSEQEVAPSSSRTPDQGTEEGLSPEQSKEEGLASEQETEEDPAPEEGEEGPAPEQETEEGPAPEQEGEEGPAPEEGEEGPAPDQETEEGPAPEQEGEEGPPPEEGEEGQAPEQEGEEGPAPEQEGEEGPAPEQEGEEGPAPEEGEEGPAPEEGEEDPAPEQETEEGPAPEQETEEGPTPEEGEEGRAPEQETEEGPAPEEGEEGPAPEEGEEAPAPEQETEEGPAPEQEGEEGLAPEQEGEEGPAPEEGEEGPAPEQETEEGPAPEEGEEGPAPEQETEEGPAPEQETEEGPAPEEGEEGPAPEQETEEGPAPEQETEEGPAPEEGEEGPPPEEGEGPAPEQETEKGLAPEQETEEGLAPEQEGEEGPASEQETEEGPAPEQEGEEGPAPEQKTEEGPAPEQEGEEGPAPEEGEESSAPERGTEEGGEQETKEGSDLEAKKVVKHLASTEMRFRNLPMDQTDGFDQDDLDF